MNSVDYLNEIANGFETCIDEVINVVDGCNQQTMNIPEGEEKWSMLQCIKHISLATQVYVDNVETTLKIEGLKPASVNFKGSWKGRFFAKMNEPKPTGEISNKLKTFKRMNPKNELNRQEVIDEFITTHQKFIDLIKQSEQVSLDKTKVSTALPIVKLRLGDAFKFILAHTRRHVVQLKRIKNVVHF